MVHLKEFVVIRIHSKLMCFLRDSKPCIQSGTECIFMRLEKERAMADEKLNSTYKCMQK